MKDEVINFKEKLAKLKSFWTPRVVAELNDYQFKVAKLRGEFVWHTHQDTDEAFIVLEGRMAIELRTSKVKLSKGEMFVVPRGVEHKPAAPRECKVLVIEPRGVVNTGDAGGVLTAENDVWV